MLLIFPIPVLQLVFPGLKAQNTSVLATTACLRVENFGWERIDHVNVNRGPYVINVGV